MSAAFLNQGLTAARDAIKTIFTNVGVSTDQTAFAATQTAINPSGSGTNLIKAATIASVDSVTFDATITINGTSEFTGLQIWTVSGLNGSTASAAVTRTVRSVSIGVQAGDILTLGPRVKVADNS